MKEVSWLRSPKLLTVFIWAYLLTGIYSLIIAQLYIPYLIILFLFFAFGNGTIAHRYFSHSNFSVNKKAHWAFALWATLTGYTPLSYWITQHRHHHRFTDTEKDIHSPVNGLAKSFIFWTLDSKGIASVFKDRASIVNLAQSMKDPAVRFFNNNFLLCNLFFLSILAVIDMDLVVAATAAYALEQFRLGIVNSLLHTSNVPGNYKNHDLPKSANSQNNYIIGLLTLGFGWHNNHHADPKKLILTEKWWEIDLEGYLGWVLSRVFKHDQTTH